VLLSLASGTALAGQTQAQTPSGGVEFPVSCSAEAQAEFTRGVVQLHHMTYPRARESFDNAARIDARCAMAHWGIAMTLFQPLWPTRPSPPDLRRGWEAVQSARTVGTRSERERVLIEAVAAFFEDPESTDYWQRIRRWEAAMSSAHDAFPHDPEVTAFFALSHLAAAPTDDKSVAAHSERAAALLLGVYERNPNHPGAMHYLVHANDAPGREHSSLDVTEKYESTAPRNPHALHMPTHIYTRLGDWSAVIRGNLLAAEAALANPAGDRGQFIWDEFPHAVEYLVYAYLQQGADDKAQAQLVRLQQTRALQPSFKTAFHLASTQARYVLERRDWSAAAAVVPRSFAGLEWDRFAWPEAVSWFARGLGMAHTGRTTEADEAIKRLNALEATARGAGEELWARNIHILSLEVQAWLAHARGDSGSSLALVREAAEMELATPKHPVTPAPTIPAPELQGDLLLASDNPAGALQAYRRSLELYPRRFNSLLGAARAARGAGDAASARQHYRALLDAAGEGSRRAELDEARTFLASRG
jgi:tetratricopeptide (TPR) repeat protein